MQRQFSTVGTSIRKVFAPMIKCIHPDFFAQENDNIRLSNLSSLQTLNLIFDNIECLQNEVIRCRASSPTIYIKTPWLKVYRINCFIREGLAEITSKDICMNIRSDVRSPNQFHSSQEAQILEVQKAIAKVISQIDDLAQKMSLSRLGGEISQSYSADSFKRESSIQFHGMSREVIVDLLQRRAAEIYVRGGHVHADYASTHTQRFIAHRVQERIKEHVNIFVSSGNVLLRNNSSPLEEFQAVERLQKFLIDNGESVDFEVDAWRRVIIVLDSKVATYVGRKVSERYLLEIPLHFKVKPFVKLLNETIPITLII